MRLAAENTQPGRLANGPIKRWVVGKPRLAATSDGYVDQGEKPKLAFVYYLGVIFRASIVIGLLVGFVAAASWLILIGTVLATPKIDGQTYVVQRAAWPESQAPAGVIALSLDSPVRRDMAGRFSLNLNNEGNPAIVRIVGGPNAYVRTDAQNRILVNDNATNAVSPTPIENHNIGTSYIAICLLGPCGTPGSPLEIPVDQVLGKVLGTPSLTGIKPISDTPGLPGGASD